MTKLNPSVFRDQNRHTCIRTLVERKHTHFVEMSVIELRVRTLPHAEFAEIYEEIPDYDVKRAANLYLYNKDGVKPLITPEALSLLRMIAGPAYQRESLANDPPSDIDPPSKPKEVSEMATPTKTPAKRAAPAKAAAKTATAAKKAAPAKKAKTEATNGAQGRAPNIAGTAKIKVLTEKGANPKRGTAAARFDLYKNGMTVDEYIAAGGKRADVNWDVGQGFIETK